MKSILIWGEGVRTLGEVFRHLVMLEDILDVFARKFVVVEMVVVGSR